MHGVPKALRYQFEDDYTTLLSDKCCYKLKKEPIHKWEKANNRKVAILGLRSSEGGMRAVHSGCVAFDDEKNIIKFKPLNPVSNEWEDWFVKTYEIKLCDLYYPPYNFRRTGCKGCPYALDLNEQLTIMGKLLPIERQQCENIWKPIYEEYRKHHYRLKEYEENLLDI